MSWALEVANLSRSFGSGSRAHLALDDITFSVAEGEICGLLGANGAGKTTLTKVLSTLLTPTSGSARVLGRDVVTQARSIRPDIGVVFGGDRGLYMRLSARRNLHYFGALAGLPRREVTARTSELLEEFGLAEVGDTPVERFSRGMIQRVHVASGLLARPRVLFLDEPTVGLDPMESARLRDDLARRARQEGMTILLTSHILRDIEQLAERILMLDRGRLVADLDAESFRRRADVAAIVRIRSRNQLAEPDWGVTVTSEATDDAWQLTAEFPTWSAAEFAKVGDFAREAGADSVDVQPATLEDAFRAISNGGS